MLRNFFIIYTFLLFFLFPASGFSDIVADDMVVLKGEETLLSAQTKGKLFPEGGRLIEFFLHGKSLGKSLSGGDGFAYKQFTPRKSGLFHMSVKSGDDEDTCVLLSLKRGAQVIFVDVEGSLLDGIFTQKPKQGSQEVIKELSRKYPLVFLQTGLLGIKVLKSWLKENGFVDMPVLAWGEGNIFEEIHKKGLRIKALIGSQSVIESAQEYKPLSLSFEEGEDTQTVKNWEEIKGMLLKNPLAR